MPNWLNIFVENKCWNNSLPCCPCLCSPKPTLEEVCSWGQSFDKLMCCPAGRNSFRQFLRTEFSEENMLFWLACDEFRKEANKSVVEEKARVIYEDYISILSPKEVWQLLISLLLKMCWIQHFDIFVICLLVLLNRCRWEDWNHSCVCTVNIKAAADNQLA